MGEVVNGLMKQILLFRNVSIILQFLQKLLVTLLQLQAALPALQYPGSYHQKTSDMES